MYIVVTSNQPRAPSQYKDNLSRYGISIIKVRRSWDRLIFIIPRPGGYRIGLFVGFRTSASMETRQDSYQSQAKFNTQFSNNV